MTETLRYFGYGKETTFGTAVDAVQHVDVASTTLDTPQGAEIIVSGGMGRGALRKRPGFYSPSGNIEYAWDIRSIGWMLRLALGGYTFTTGETGPPKVFNLHEIYGNNNVVLPSFTARCGKDNFEHIFPGSVIDTLSLSVQDNLASATVGVLSQKDAKATLQQPADLLLPTEYPFAFYDFTGTINSVDKSAIIQNFTLDIANNVNQQSGRTIGSRHPRKFRAGDRVCSLSVSLDFEDLTYLEAFWGSATGPVNLGSTIIPFKINGQASATEGSIEFNFPHMVIMGIQTQPRGREAITQTLRLQAITDPDLMLADGTTEVSTDIYVKLQNDEPTMA